MNAFKAVIYIATICAAVFFASTYSAEIDEFEIINSENNPVRKEFDNHTVTCFKVFKSSMIKLAVLFLDPESESTDTQHESRCWVKCMLEQFEFMKIARDNANGETAEILPPRIIEKATDLSPRTRTKLSTIVEECKNYAAPFPEVCNKAFGFAKCVFDKYRGFQRGNMVPVVPVVAVSPTPAVVAVNPQPVVITG